jgi:hypothetical protein
MFDSLRAAWSEAVGNFWQELHRDEGSGEARHRAMYAQVGQARNEISRLERQISDCRRGRDAERAEAEVCARRERLARDIGDAETARVAAEYRARHEERAAVLGRKLDVLAAEQGLRRRDLEEMEAALAALGGGGAAAEIEDLDRHPREAEFQDLERAARDRAAAERLEEMKRRSHG